MLYRTVSILIVLFWVVMMSLLVRRTYFPEQTVLSQVPYAVVLRAVLDCDEQPTLNIRNTKQLDANGKPTEMGEWRLLVERVQPTHDETGEIIDPSIETSLVFSWSWKAVSSDAKGTTEWKSAYYRISNDLMLEVKIEPPARVQIKTDSFFDPRLRLTRFKSSVRLGQYARGHFQSDEALVVTGSKASGEVTVQSHLPGLSSLPPIPFSRLEQASLSGLLAPGSLPNVAALAQLPSLSGLEGNVLPTSKTSCREERVRHGGKARRTYVIENQYSENFRVKIYVGRSGEVWKVELPFGIEMTSDETSFLQ